MIPVLRHEKYKISLEPLVVTESKEGKKKETGKMNTRVNSERLPLAEPETI